MPESLFKAAHADDTTTKGKPMSLLIKAAGRLAMALPVIAVLLAFPATSYAQHGNYLLGTLGLLGGSQAPEGIYYENLFSYYTASGSGNLDASRARSLELLGRQLNLTVNGSFNRNSSLDVYIDQNILGVTTPLKIFGANYGLMVDVPFSHVTGSGTASLDLGADLRGIFDRNFTRSTSLEGGRSSTASFNISDLYVEPINLGWHLPHLDILATFGFMAPTGDYNSRDAINNGLGRWAELFGLGAVAYLDQAKSWSISAMTHYITHQSQQGIDLRVGDDLALEWGLGKTFRPASWQPWVPQLDTGVVGYAQWQVTDNTGSAIPNPLRGIRSNIFAVGPEISATTMIGRFTARYEFEFGAQNSMAGQIFLFGWAALWDPFK